MYNNSSNIITQVMPQDEALDAFRKLFNLPAQQVIVSEDGMSMRMRVMQDRVATRFLLDAQTIIDSNKLPLAAEIDEDILCGVLFNRWVVITFIGPKTALPCY